MKKLCRIYLMCKKLWRSFLFHLFHQQVCHKLFLRASESPAVIQIQGLHVSDAL